MTRTWVRIPVAIFTICSMVVFITVLLWRLWQSLYSCYLKMRGLKKAVFLKMRHSSQVESETVGVRPGVRILARTSVILNVDWYLRTMNSISKPYRLLTLFGNPGHLALMTISHLKVKSSHVCTLTHLRAWGRPMCWVWIVLRGEQKYFKDLIKNTFYTYSKEPVLDMDGGRIQLTVSYLFKQVNYIACHWLLLFSL